MIEFLEIEFLEIEFLEEDWPVYQREGTPVNRARIERRLETWRTA